MGNNNPLHEQFVGNRLDIARPWVFAIVFLSCPCMLLWFNYLDQPIWPDPAYQTKETRFNSANSNTPPASGWQPISELNAASMLPDEHGFYSVWLAFDANGNQLPEEEQLSLMFPTFWANYVLYVGDEKIAQAAPITIPLYINRSPRLYPLTRSQFEDGNQTIFARSIRAVPWHDPLTFYVGPHDQLVASYESQYLVRMQRPILALVIVLLVTVAVATLFLLRPSHTFYGWYALTIGLFGAHSAWYIIADSPIPWLEWGLLGRYTLFMAVAQLIFHHRYFGQRYRLFENLVYLVFAVSALYMGYTAFFQIENYAWSLNFYTLVLLAVSVYTNGFLLYALYRWNNFEGLVLTISSINHFVVSTRDIFYQVGLVETGTHYYSQYSSALMGMAFFYLLLRRFSASMKEVSDLNTDLEKRVAQKALDLEASYAQLSAVQGQQMLVEERTRLMRDMHDGLGGQLIHALALTDKSAQQDQIQKALKLAIEDLRMIIDSLAPEDSTLATLVPSIRHRMTSLLDDVGIRSRWLIAENMDQELSPQQALALLRFLQEALTNVVRHSKANEVIIDFDQSQQDKIQLTIQDDGIGLTNTNGQGRGLSSLRQRALELGGELEIHSQGKGTLIRCDVVASHA